MSVSNSVFLWVGFFTCLFGGLLIIASLFLTVIDRRLKNFGWLKEFLAWAESRKQLQAAR